MHPEYPVQIHIAGYPLLLHGIMEFIALLVGSRYYFYLRKKQGDSIESTNRLWILIGAALGAVIGLRIIGSLENAPQWFASSAPLVYFWGNKTLVGGLAGGLVGVETVKKILGEKQKSGDLFVYPLILAMIIGRIGCFSAGVYEETYGIPTQLPWAMDLGDGILRHPVTLYEIIFLMLLWFSLVQVQKRYELQQGALFKIFLISYLAFRLMLDLIKPGLRYFLGMGTIQLTCLLGLLYYIRYIINPRLLIIQKRLYAR